MKTTILTIAVLLIATFGIHQSSFAASRNTSEESTILPAAAPINNIEIHGNVELYLSTGTADQVKVYNTYYAENALVQNKGGNLRITSYKAEKLVVWVTVSDLRNISVYDNAEVKSFGKLATIDLQVNLYNSAKASLNVDAYHADVVLMDLAKANICGDVHDGSMKYDLSATLNTVNLVSTQLIKTANFRDGDDLNASALATL